jgi:hypothetical protein
MHAPETRDGMTALSLPASRCIDRWRGAVRSSPIRRRATVPRAARPARRASPTAYGKDHAVDDAAGSVQVVMVIGGGRVRGRTGRRRKAAPQSGATAWGGEPPLPRRHTPVGAQHHHDIRPTSNVAVGDISRLRRGRALIWINRWPRLGGGTGYWAATLLGGTCSSRRSWPSASSTMAETTGAVASASRPIVSLPVESFTSPNA